MNQTQGAAPLPRPAGVLDAGAPTVHPVAVVDRDVLSTLDPADPRGADAPTLRSAGPLDADALSLRPAGLRDAEALARMLTGLTDLSLYFRFQTAIGRPPRPALLDRLLDPAGRAWVATRDTTIVGHGMWAWAAGTTAPRQQPLAELAVVVSDEEQGRGLGTRLLLAAALDARSCGAERFLFVVSPANDRTARKIRRTWPDASAERDGDLINFLIPVSQLHHLAR